MSTRKPPSRGAYLSGLGLAAGALIAVSACSSSTHSNASSAPRGSASTATAKANSANGAPTGAPAGVTISAMNVSGYGTVLVNGSGRTLYMLSSEKGGKLTCTDDNGCTRIWPDTELPAGINAATAGSGIDSSLLGTIKDAQGSLYVAYNGWPLYTFSGDSAAGQANGEGITSFGGTWDVIGAAGQPVTSKTATSQGAPGYGY